MLQLAMNTFRLQDTLLPVAKHTHEANVLKLQDLMLL